MKTLTKFTATLATVFALSACSSTGVIDPTAATNTAVNTIGTANNIGTAVFQAAVDQKCRSEITNNQYYKIAKVAMTAEQQTQLQTNVCGCVSQNAMQQVNIVDLATAATNPTARTQLVTQAVANTLQTCVGQFVK